MNANFTLDSAMFASEFASFVSFVGSKNLDSALAKASQKLGGSVLCSLIRFSGDPMELETKPIFNSDRLFSQAKSIGGFCYDVPNPNCRFPMAGDF